MVTQTSYLHMSTTCGCNSTNWYDIFCNVSPAHSIWADFGGQLLQNCTEYQNFEKKYFFRLDPQIFCTKFGDNCSNFVGGVAKKQIWTKFKMAENCGTYGSKVISQNIKFIVIAPPSGQIAPNSTLHSLGSSTINPTSVKAIGWTVVKIIKGQTDRFLVFIVRCRDVSFLFSYYFPTLCLLINDVHYMIYSIFHIYCIFRFVCARTAQFIICIIFRLSLYSSMLIIVTSFTIRFIVLLTKRLMTHLYTCGSCVNLTACAVVGKVHNPIAWVKV